MLQPDRESVKLMRDFVGKISKPGDFMLDAFAKTFSTTKACLFLDKLS